MREMNVLFVAAAIGLATGASAQATAPPDPQARAGSATESAPPTTPPGGQARTVSMSDLAGNAPAYYGQRITVTSDVGDVVDPRGFTLDSDTASAGPDVLVVNPGPDASQSLRGGEQVTVTGTLRRFVRAELDREFGWFGELGKRWETEYHARPVLVADSIRTSSGRELVSKGSGSSEATAARAGSGMPAKDDDLGTGRGDPTIAAAQAPPGTPPSYSGGSSDPAGSGSVTATTATSSTGRPSATMAATAGELANNPASYYGKRVSVTAEVEDVKDENSFTLDEDKLFAGPDVLVIFPGASHGIPENRNVTVTGKVVRYVAAELDRDYDWFVPQADWEVEYRERPVIMADSVKTEDGRELLKTVQVPARR